jgi:hypothetical protein
MQVDNPNLELRQGSISDLGPLDELVSGVDFVVLMLGDAKLQEHENINASFVERLVPAMRNAGVKQLLYQAGGFTKPYRENLPIMSWILKNTLARFSNLLGQHRDNEAVLKYLVEQCSDIEWIVHRASIVSDAPSKGSLKRSKGKFSLATFGDCANYNYRTIMEEAAIHTYDLSYYAR